MVNWGYSGSGKVSFKVNASPNGSLQNVATTNGKSAKISGVEKGSTYTIQVITIDRENQQNQSEPVTTTVDIPEDTEQTDKPGEEQPDEEPIPQ